MPWCLYDRELFVEVSSLFNCVGSGDQTQVIDLDNKYLYQLSYLTSLFLKNVAHVCVCVYGNKFMTQAGTDARRGC